MELQNNSESTIRFTFAKAEATANSGPFAATVFEPSDCEGPRSMTLNCGVHYFRNVQTTSGILTTGDYPVEMPASAILSLTEGCVNKDTDALFSTLYAELHRLAKRQLARQWAPISLGVTTLLHEAYLNMADRNQSLFPDEARFMGYAARVMRGLIVDHARTSNATKRGGKFEITSLSLNDAGNPVDAKELSSINDALEELAQVEPDLATLVDLKFFCGFSFAEISAMQGTSERTAKRKWEKARIYLHRSIRADLSL